jgi:rhodanese-related sulfurtransferase
MKLFLFFIALLTIVNANAQAPFKYDSLYDKLYAKDLCALMQKNKNVQLIDVRSAGEFSDTSRWASLNIGHLKGAVNITIDTLLKHTELLKPYEGKTLVFYCSHSQRSRRVSKALKEKGYTNFYNLNGGMSSLNELNASDFPCKENMIVSATSYKNLNAKQCANLIDSEKDLVIVDVRSGAIFNSKDSMTWNNIGHLKKAINIPYSKNPDISPIKKAKNAPILVCGDGGDPARFAKMLSDEGFSKVYHMRGGIYFFNAKAGNRKYFDDLTPYVVVDEKEGLRLLKEENNLVILDTRSEKDFYNKNEKDRSWNNLGHIKNAVHAPDLSKVMLPKDLKVPILIYGENPSRVLAKDLCAKGYTNVFVLESYWDFVWSAFNMETSKENKNYLVDHAGFY